jgi:hypothetical protein
MCEHTETPTAFLGGSHDAVKRILMKAKKRLGKRRPEAPLAIGSVSSFDYPNAANDLRSFHSVERT